MKMSVSGEKIQKRWDRKKHKVSRRCPNCKGHRIWLKRSMSERFKKYSLECERCHWVIGNAITINGAIKMWNEYRRRGATT